MITIEKINIYKEYRGYYDGYYTKNKTLIKKVITDEEWYLISGLIHDILLVRKGIASKSFEVKLNERLRANCLNDKTVGELRNPPPAFVSSTNAKWDNREPLYTTRSG